MWPLLLLFGAGAGIYYYATSGHAAGTDGGGPPATKCILNGEQFQAAINKLDPTTGGLIMAAYSNPMATKAALTNLAVEVRKLKASGFVEADQIADCIEVKASQATS